MSCAAGAPPRGLASGQNLMLGTHGRYSGMPLQDSCDGVSCWPTAQPMHPPVTGNNISFTKFKMPTTYTGYICSCAGSFRSVRKSANDMPSSTPQIAHPTFTTTLNHIFNSPDWRSARVPRIFVQRHGSSNRAEVRSCPFLGGIGEFERDLIRARAGEGRERAKARGFHMGRLPAVTRHQREEALRELAKGKATQAELARRFNVSRITVSRLAP